MLLPRSFLGASDTGFIVDYYFTMYVAMVLIAGAVGLLLLPVLLSLFGGDEIGEPTAKPAAKLRGPGRANPAYAAHSASAAAGTLDESKDGYITVAGQPARKVSSLSF